MFTVHTMTDVRLYSYPELRELDRIDKAYVKSVEFSPDSNFVLVDGPESATVYSLNPLIDVVTIVGDEFHFSLTELFVLNENELRVYDVHGFSLLRSMTLDMAWPVAFSSNSELIAGCSSDTIRVWRTMDGCVFGGLDIKNEYLMDSNNSLVFSPVEDVLAVGIQATGELTLVDLNTGSSLTSSLFSFASFSFSPDGARLLACGFFDRVVYIVRTSDLTVEFRLSIRDVLLRVVFSLNPLEIAELYSDHVDVRNIITGDIVQTLPVDSLVLGFRFSRPMMVLL
jgi:WD40 repeat protein